MYKEMVLWEISPKRLLSNIYIYICGVLCWQVHVHNSTMGFDWNLKCDRADLRCNIL